jgi:aryl-alcohol dehydrogenase-like predicted oxidoreductase
MQYSSLGNTNLKVSRLALGTVELGMDYGFRNSTHYKMPDVDQAIRIVDRSLDLGINFIDTARGYGESETILGRALHCKRDRVVIASKVAIDENYLNNSEKLRLVIEESIEKSLRALHVYTIDLLQIHNTHRKILANDVVLGTLSEAQTKGNFRFLGASCVGEKSAFAAFEFPQVRAMMIPLNILDRQMVPRVFPMAESQGVIHDVVDSAWRFNRSISRCSRCFASSKAGCGEDRRRLCWRNTRPVRVGAPLLSLLRCGFNRSHWGSLVGRAGNQRARC